MAVGMETLPLSYASRTASRTAAIGQRHGLARLVPLFHADYPTHVPYVGFPTFTTELSILAQTRPEAIGVLFVP
jgi:hypothetical protein